MDSQVAAGTSRHPIHSLEFCLDFDVKHTQKEIVLSRDCLIIKSA